METPETEIKFLLSEAAQTRLAGHRALAGPASVSRLRSTYFDTPAGDLRRAGLGLRVRATKGGFVQTLKCADAHGPIVRREWECGVRGDQPDLRALARTPARDVLRATGETLAPVFRTDIERTTRLWIDEATLVEVSIDNGEIAAGGRHAPVRELELELKAGDPSALIRIAQDIVAHAQLPLATVSKAERGYELAAGPAPPAHKAQPLAIGRKDAADDSFRRIGWNCLTQIALNSERLAAARSIEALHQLRIGLRRLRAALSVFRDMLAGEGLTDLKRETRWLAGELDRARDMDVLIHEHFRKTDLSDADRSAAARLGHRLLVEQTAGYEAAITAITSARYADFLLKTATFLEMGDWTIAGDPAIRAAPVGAFAATRLDRLRRQVVQSGRKFDELSSEARHQLRIKAKKLRYAAAFFAQAFGGRAERREGRFGRTLTELQARLGEVQDIAVARRLMGELALGEPPEVAFLAGIVVGARGRSEAGARSRKAFERFKAARPFWR